jgi:gamma-D-glutamyl-L-lysine dipeptidyl-peptidase
LPLLPLRSEPSDRAEMTTQLLFGELFEVQEEGKDWTRIRNLADGYEGWCTTKMLTFLSVHEWTRLRNTTPFLTQQPFTSCRKTSSDVPTLFLPAGSRIYDLDPSTGIFTFCETSTWVLDPKDMEVPFAGQTSALFVQMASCFIHAPYLWGGKSILGMDCSGLVQLSASFCGVFLPRDASDQVLKGDEIFLMEAQPGDLAFFVNAERRVVHVGIIIGNGKILHASGCVHIDTLDELGIYSEKQECHTHQLYVVKRIFSDLNE